MDLFRVAARAVVCAAVVMAPVSLARGAITIFTTPNTGPTFTVTPVGSKYRVTLNTSITSQPTTFSVRGAAADQIENIIINAPVIQTVFLEVRGPSTGTTLASVDSIDKGTSTATVVLSELRTSGAVGSIRVNTITGMNVGGDVMGDIELPQRTSGESTIVNGTVTGRIRGNIFVDHGAIFGLTATGGIGAPGAPVQVRTKNNIVRLTAKEIYADITTLASGGTGWMGKIETTGGPFVGSLTTGAIAQTGPSEPGVLSVLGDLDADVFVTGAVKNENGGLPVVNVTGRLMPGRTFKIGTSLNAGAPFKIGTNAGLQGQVIVNSWGGAGTWAGSVAVGSSTLGPVPTYSALMGQVGGGAVGVVPFAQHGGDSWPAQGAVLNSAQGPTPSQPIRVRYYGPVAWGSGVPLIIETRANGSTGAWTDVTTCFSISREPGGSPSANVVAAYPVRAMSGGQYRVRPVLSGPSAIVCDIGLPVNPVVATPVSDYTFSILGAGSGCTGDADGNGVVNFADISMLLSNWGSGGGGGGGGGCFNSVDVNGDGSINFADITVVLISWGSNCQ